MRPADPGPAAQSQFLTAVRAGEVSAAIWGCGHIGASALFHLAVAGVRCFGYDTAPERVRAIEDGHFLATEVTHPAPPATTPDTAVAPLRVSVTANWRDLLYQGIGLHLVCVPTDRGIEPSARALEEVAEQACEVIRADGPLRIAGEVYPRLLSSRAPSFPRGSTRWCCPRCAKPGWS